MVETAQAEASENWKWSRSRIQTASGTYLETDSPWNSWSGSTTHCWIVPLGTPGVDSVSTIVFLFSHAVVSMAILTGETVHRQLFEISWADARYAVSQSESVTTEILNGLLAFDHLHRCFSPGPTSAEWSLSVPITHIFDLKESGGMLSSDCTSVMWVCNWSDGFCCHLVAKYGHCYVNHQRLKVALPDKSIWRMYKALPLGNIRAQPFRIKCTFILRFYINTGIIK